MARPKANVPSVDEIMAKMRRESNQRNVAPIEQRQAREKSLESRVEALTEEVRRMPRPGKMTAAELREAMEVVFQKYDMDPMDELVRIVMERNPDGAFILDADQRIRVLGELLSYRMPKLKAMEVGGAVAVQHTINIVRYGEDGKRVIESKVAAAPGIIDVKALPEVTKQ